MRSVLASAVLLAACRGSTATVTPRDDAAESLGAFARAQVAKQNPELYCLEAVDDAKIHDQAIVWTILASVAEACRGPQPLLAQAAGDASRWPTTTSEQASILLRAARNHPAFPKECEILDDKADLPVAEAFRGRSGCSDAAHRPYVSAGTYLFMVVIARVAWRAPESPPLWFGHWAFAEHYERWKEGKVKGRLP